MNIACLDFEGVLVPEIWIGLAERTRIPELRLTTRDIPDYDKLMSNRLSLMKKHGLKYLDIQEAAGSLEPLPGAKEFLGWLRTQYQVAIISDTFYELAASLIAKLDHPMLLCHRLSVGGDGTINDYRLRQPDPKRHAVRAFQSMEYRVAAVGDSYNDISMLTEADYGVFFRPPENVRQDYPDIPVATSYEELRLAFEDARQRFS